MPSFPILARAYRTQWRRPSPFLWLFLLTFACALAFGLTYADGFVALGSVEVKLNSAGESLWIILAWLQTALALLVAPALSAGAIARERERGLLDGLIMAPIPPFRIIVEKWLGTLAPLLLIFVVLMPFGVIASVLQTRGNSSLLAIWGFQLLLAGTSAAIGIACSAWARRAHLALRSAYGLVILWILGSGTAATLSGISPLGPFVFSSKAPLYLKWFGYTNPILGAFDLIMDDASGVYWPGASAALLAILILCAYSATRALKKPLKQAPFIGDGRAAARKKRAREVENAGEKIESKASESDHFEVPFVGGLRFANPVLGREVRSKFRLRQPPLGVIIFEIILALLVAGFYARTLWAAFTDPSVRGVIFWGVAMTGFIVTLMSCVIMGANGFSREHEGGTWESLRLSLLRPREIVWGKAVGIALTCLLFSIPVWPLLLPCVNWNKFWQSTVSNYDVTISQFIALIVVWLGTVATATLWGLWWGRRTRKTSAASGASLGTSALWFAGVPLLFLLLESGSNTDLVLMWLNPFSALSQTNSDWLGGAAAFGLPFLAFSLLFSVGVAASLERAMKREFG